MKKILLTLVSALFCLGSMAQKPGLFTTYDFSETVVFEQQINKQTPVKSKAQASQQQVIDSRLADLDEFIVKEFTIPAMSTSGSSLPLGDIDIKGFTITTDEDGINHFSYDGTYTFDVSNLPTAVQEEAKAWFTDVPVKLEGKFKGTKLYAVFRMLVTMTSGSTTNRLVITATYGTDDFAKVYTEPLVVTVNGVKSDPQDTDVTVYTNDDETIDFELKNFVLTMGEESMPIGNIVVKNLTVTKGEDGLDHFSYEGNITIEEGDQEGVEMWFGPLLCVEYGAIPIKLTGQMNDEKLYVTIDIDMSDTGLGQVINVQLGTDDFPAPAREGKVYTEPLVVTVNGVKSDPQDTDVTVYTNDDETIDFELKNFVLTMGEESMPIGNIVVKNLTVTKGEDGLDHFSYEGNITIEEGDQEGVEMWFGPLLCVEYGAIPIKLTGQMNDEKLYVTIDIDMSDTGLGQVINVQLGTKRGDVNGDNNIDIADVVAVLNIMAAGTEDPAGNVNGDTAVDIADVVAVLNLMAQQ